MGETFHESSPCIPYSQCRTKKNKKQKKESPRMPCERWIRNSFLFCNDDKQRLPWRFHIKNGTRVFLFNNQQNKKPSPNFFSPRPKKTQKKQQTYVWNFFFDTFFWGFWMGGANFSFPKIVFTDLSTVGLPAELKHITQRWKRKQPWFPQSAASEEGPNSLPNRALQSLELWQKRC